MLLIVDCGSEKTRQIVATLESLGASCEVYSEVDLPNLALERFAGMIISGSPELLCNSDIEERLSRFGCISTIGVPVLGICFGHQIIGLHFGANFWKGMYIRKPQLIEQVCSNDLFKGIKPFSSFDQSHSEYIGLPKKFKLLAKSASARNEAMMHLDLPIFGVQFHPETSDLNGKILFRNFILLCSKYNSEKSRGLMQAELNW
ncbi:MAG: hypothetical protein RIS47_1121 [Bacteroidota bacterium]|jgi:GMP synthase (glutamine-hydrolysing)